MLAAAAIRGTVGEEAIEDALDMPGRKARPAVLDADDTRRALGRGRDFDEGVGRRETRRIVEQVFDDLRKAI